MEGDTANIKKKNKTRVLRTIRSCLVNTLACTPTEREREREREREKRHKGSFAKAQSIHQRQKCAMGRGSASHLGHGV